MLLSLNSTFTQLAKEALVILPEGSAVPNGAITDQVDPELRSNPNDPLKHIFISCAIILFYFILHRRFHPEQEL